MQLRRLTQSDRQKYIEMTSAFYCSDAVDHSVDFANFEKTFDMLITSDTYADCFIIEQDSDICGYILTAKTYSQEAGGICVWLEEIWIEPQFRSLGIGKSAILETIKHYQNAARFRLEYTDANQRAAALYRRLGFEPLEYRQMCLDK